MTISLKYMVMSRDENPGRSQDLKIDIVPLKGWNSSNIWEQPEGIKFCSGRN